MKAVCSNDFRITEAGANEACDQCFADFKRGEEYEVEVRQDTYVINGSLRTFWQAIVRAPHDDSFGFPLYAIFNRPSEVNNFFTFK